MRTLVIEEHRLLLHRRLCENLFQRKADAEALINLSRSHLGSERICAKLENVVCDADVIALDAAKLPVVSARWVGSPLSERAPAASPIGTAHRAASPSR